MNRQEFLIILKNKAPSLSNYIVLNGDPAEVIYIPAPSSLGFDISVFLEEEELTVEIGPAHSHFDLVSEQQEFFKFIFEIISEKLIVLGILDNGDILKTYILESNFSMYDLATEDRNKNIKITSHKGTLSKELNKN